MPVRRDAARLAIVASAVLLAVLLGTGRDSAASTSAPVPGRLAAAPAATAPAVELAGDMVWLRDRMIEAIENYWAPGRYAVAVTDLQTGETVSVNGDRPQLSGCVVNLFALIHALRDVWWTRYPLDHVDSLIASTIWSSNATTARDLYSVIGSGDATEGVRRVERLVREELALSAVVLDHPPAYGDSIGTSPDNWVTADSMNAALAALWHGQALPEPSWRDFLLYQMTQVKPGLNYLTAVVPEVVSHKNGFMWTPEGYVDNDIGIVRLQRGGAEYAYALSFLSEGVGDEYADIPLGQELAHLAYAVMSARYP